MPSHNIVDTYKLLLKIISIPSFKELVIFLLTAKLTFSAFDNVTLLKLIEAGVPKEGLVILSSLSSSFLQLALPVFFSKYIAGPNPVGTYITAIPFRMAISLIGPILFWWASRLLDESNHVPYYFYIALFLMYCCYHISTYCMIVPLLAFFVQISDPTFGGTYMTLLNTVNNLGGSWSSTVVLWLVDVLTWRNCYNSKSDSANFNANRTEIQNKVITINTFSIEYYFHLNLNYFFFL